jgi:hypothetical protein
MRKDRQWAVVRGGVQSNNRNNMYYSKLKKHVDIKENMKNIIKRRYNIMAMVTLAIILTRKRASSTSRNI